MQTTCCLHALYLPQVRKFRVQVSNGKECWIELMSLAQFLRLVKSPEEIKVADMIVRVENDKDGEVMAAMRAYLKGVAEAFLKVYLVK